MNPLIEVSPETYDKLAPSVQGEVKAALRKEAARLQSAGAQRMADIQQFIAAKRPAFTRGEQQINNSTKQI